MTFDAASVSVLATPGGGALQGNGLAEAIEGAGAIEVIDDRTIELVIDRMPENSSFSFNVTGVLDDTTDAMVLHHRLIGEDPNCEPTVPPTDPEVPPTDPETPASPETPEVPASTPEPVSSVATQQPAQLAKTGATPGVDALGIAMVLLSGVGALILGRRITARRGASLT